MSALRQTFRVAPMFTVPAPALAAKPTELPPEQLLVCARATLPPEEALLRALPSSQASNALPFDLTVPRRVPLYEGFATTLSHRAACLLLHVDGCSTLADIAAHTSLPRDVVLDIFLELLGTGSVELDVLDRDRRTPPPSSGVFRKSVAPPGR